MAAAWGSCTEVLNSTYWRKAKDWRHLDGSSQEVITCINYCHQANSGLVCEASWWSEFVFNALNICQGISASEPLTSVCVCVWGGVRHTLYVHVPISTHEPENYVQVLLYCPLFIAYVPSLYSGFWPSQTFPSTRGITSVSNRLPSLKACCICACMHMQSFHGFT